ncbi:S41 family peptidase [Agrilutibacter solisilvae]|uniref:S41 family peptidase n=1 Tax=Agrilutibacter solisilvae TaxID=2763317 RepID=A0A974XZM4_9GAMM|nr:S41 family peptidase [Lysobacter solisilvae]QSX78568.1 S41 family peptidase [Lysobacter solisilvae]
MKPRTLTLCLLLCLAPFAHAQQPPPAVPITAAQRATVIEGLATQLQANYVFPDVAGQLAKTLRARNASGAYAAASDSRAFSELLSTDLRRLGKDGHFNVDYDPEFREQPPGKRPLPSKEEIEQGRQQFASRGYGIDSLARLPGNVGYMELRGFGPTELVGEALSAAMTLLSGTDALILDLRRNGGGEPATVAYLMSHFFAPGDERHLNDIYSRTDDTTRQYWTDPSVGPRYTKPVYVLTSKRTFSGGEECAYDFQTQQRGTLVGESTGGGANPGDPYALGAGFVAFIPNGRAINPVTHTNWEHVGVKPDIEVPAAQARQAAHAAILRGLLKEAKDAERRQELEEVLAKVEAGTVDAPVYTPRR